MALVTLGCQVLVASTFAVAAISKRPGKAFAEFTRSTGLLLPPRVGRWRRPVALGVFAAELAVVVLTLLPATAAAGFALATVTTTGFTIAIAAALRRGERAPCRCFGAGGTPLGPVHLARNLVLIVVAVAGLLTALLSPAGPTEPALAVVTVIAALTVASLVIRLDDLVALFAPSPYHPNKSK
ncbi:MauE/DoxX family redox-associated membrane protein [Streptosporangium sp. NPDC020072]|uniref:MauE/DoxX family redox-associated membrane protein n=1 Tax=Streptosporangium sp. NPDC020072 TaxID=3154788 RepID=UPI0034419F53